MNIIQIKEQSVGKILNVDYKKIIWGEQKWRKRPSIFY